MLPTVTPRIRQQVTQLYTSIPHCTVKHCNLSIAIPEFNIIVNYFITHLKKYNIPQLCLYFHLSLKFARSYFLSSSSYIVLLWDDGHKSWKRALLFSLLHTAIPGMKQSGSENEVTKHNTCHKT